MPKPQASPETKAQAVAEVLAGASYAVVAKKHGVNKATVGLWVSHARTKIDGKLDAPGLQRTAETTAHTENRREFTERFYSLIGKTFDMMDAWAKVCTDEEWIKSKPSEANELGRTVIDRCDRLVALLAARRNGDGSA